MDPKFPGKVPVGRSPSGAMQRRAAFLRSQADGVRWRATLLRAAFFVAVLTPVTGAVATEIIGYNEPAPPLTIERVEKLPPDLQKEYAAIFKACTKSGPVKDRAGRVTVGSIQRTLGACRKKTAAALAQRLFDLYFDLMRKMNSE